MNSSESEMNENELQMNRNDSIGEKLIAGSEHQSAVLTAMGVDPAFGLGTIRLSTGRDMPRVTF